MDFLDEWFPVLLILIAVVNALTKNNKNKSDTQSAGRNISASLQDVDDKPIETSTPFNPESQEIYPDTACSSEPVWDDSPEIISDNNYYDIKTISEALPGIEDQAKVAAEPSLSHGELLSGEGSNAESILQHEKPGNRDCESLQSMLQNKQNMRLAVILSEIINRPYK